MVPILTRWCDILVGRPASCCSAGMVRSSRPAARGATTVSPRSCQRRHGRERHISRRVRHRRPTGRSRQVARPTGVRREIPGRPRWLVCGNRTPTWLAPARVDLSRAERRRRTYPAGRLSCRSLVYGWSGGVSSSGTIGWSCGHVAADGAGRVAVGSAQPADSPGPTGWPRNCGVFAHPAGA